MYLLGSPGVYPLLLMAFPFFFHVWDQFFSGKVSSGVGAGSAGASDDGSSGVVELPAFPADTGRRQF